MYELLDELIAALKSALPGAKEVRLYKGEFEPDAEWNPVFPVALVKADSVNGQIRSQKLVSALYTISVYIGVKSDIAGNRTFFDECITVINEMHLNSGNQFTGLTGFQLNSITLLGYSYGVDIWRAELIIGKKL